MPHRVVPLLPCHSHHIDGGQGRRRTIVGRVSEGCIRALLSMSWSSIVLAHRHDSSPESHPTYVEVGLLSSRAPRADVGCLAFLKKIGYASAPGGCTLRFLLDMCSHVRILCASDLLLRATDTIINMKYSFSMRPMSYESDFALVSATAYVCTCVASSSNAATRGPNTSLLDFSHSDCQL
ncbi:hypothetical protein CC86DRAFT_193110 [Ophiobolus disseminans]|uniref:Uncharacterized protein n=1 Tax=Ophiobolus disseminans TaxID=1469910 RepID=A0A6A7A552_9PLEO|nr:hypothetical protein CC86DRAFT_193110 [Ophiobolus disseminans]